MSSNNILKELSNLMEVAFKDSAPNLAVLKEIKTSLFKVEKKDREILKPFVLDLKNRLFKNNTSIPGLDLELFFKDSDTGGLPEEKIITVDVQIENVEVKLTFDELLKELLNCVQDTISDLKGYAILKLSNQGNSKFGIKVLYDENYFHAPIKNRINKTFNECDSSTISDFNNEIKKGFVPDTNLLCIVLLTSKINDENARKDTSNNLSEIIDSFDEFEYCTLKEFGKYDGEFYKRTVEKDDFLEELNYVTSKFLSNGKIGFEEEKIIKKCFENSRSPVLSYKLLKEGNSGAKVVEIRPVKSHTSGQYERRFIVKYSKIEEDRKLKEESKNFTDFIHAYEGNDEYKCSHYKTTTYEALKYDFAKSKGAVNSYSFAAILSDSKNPYAENTSQLVSELFKLDIFKDWKKESIEKCKSTLRELYSRYVDFDKVKEQVLKIENISDDDFEKLEFKTNLDKLLNYEIEVNKKICHGDLHSENFFKDDKQKLFLIDFGYTGIEHSLIDHTSLECSVKFKHIPNYIKLNVLLDVENELLLDDTFEEYYIFKVGQIRKDIAKYCEIIRQIRLNSLEFFLDDSKRTEYYISLFFMTYRQVRYSDMNQSYAFESAKLILRKLVIDLGL